MDAVALWLLGQVIVPDAYSRFLDVLQNKAEWRRLRDAVRGETGLRPGRQYRRWLGREETWNDLVEPSQEGYQRLIDSLAAAKSRGIFKRRVPDRDEAARLVNATVGHFLASLEPSRSVAVADFRATRRHGELLARLDASRSFEERLTMLPAPARLALTGADVPRGPAEKLVDAVVRSDPTTIVGSLVAVEPQWLADAPAIIHLALAEVAYAYGNRAEAGLLFERVADLGLDRSRNYAKAAFAYTTSGQAERRADLTTKARSAGHDPIIDMIEGALDSDPERALSAVDSHDAAGDSFSAAVYANALHARHGTDQAIMFLIAVAERESQRAGIHLMLSRLLLQRSTEPGTTSRARDLKAAQEWAVRARDVRRQWRGNSGEAVTLACQAASIANDPERVIELGAAEPEGTAAPDEAAETEVQFFVAQAAIALGSHSLAQQIVASTSGFRQALISADLLVNTDASRASVAEQYDTAWELATTDQERVDFWVSVSMAGIEPVPGADILNQRSDDLPLVVAGFQHIAHERFDDAVTLLRPHRGHERARLLLVQAYMGQGDVDSAVTELGDVADRFDEPMHLVSAVRILVGAGRLGDAADLADRALVAAGEARHERSFLHEVGVAAASGRADWPDMEARSRNWIQQCGPSIHRLWSLVAALFKQANSTAAWRVSQEHGDLEPHDPQQAQLWIMLHAEHSPSTETLSGALAWCERFPDDPHVRAAATNAFLLKGDSNIDISAEELPRWHALLRRREEEPAPHDAFHSLSVPEDADALVEMFRPLLEPQAMLMAEWTAKVRKGWPYGMLAEVSGRSYTAALVHRAAGFLPIASADSRTIDRERKAAIAALDGIVLADASVLTTAWYIKERWPALLGAFTKIELTLDTKKDCAIAAAALRPRSSSNLGWDITSGRPVMHDVSQADLKRIDEHLTWVHDVARSLSTHPSVSERDQSSDGPDMGAWMTTFQAAKASGRILWADDVGLRVLAHNEGVLVFGTDSLLRALAALGKLTNDELDSSIDLLRNEYGVDFPLAPAWAIETAQRDNWRAGPATLVFARASTWMELTRALQLWQEIVNCAGHDDPAAVPIWVRAASLGIAAAVDPPTARDLLAGIIIAAASAVDSDPATFAACVLAAQASCDEEQIPDPLESALKRMLDVIAEQVDPAAAASAVARLGSELSDGNRELLRELLFDL